MYVCIYLIIRFEDRLEFIRNDLMNDDFVAFIANELLIQGGIDTTHTQTLQWR